MRTYLLLGALLLAFSCTRGLSSFGNTEVDWIEGTWFVEQIRGVETGILAEREPEEVPNLEISLGEMRFSGTDGCNRYFGSILKAEASTLRLGQAAGTMMACPDMELSEAFLKALESTHAWGSEDGTLVLYDDNGEELLRFTKSP